MLWAREEGWCDEIAARRINRLSFHNFDNDEHKTRNMALKVNNDHLNNTRLNSNYTFMSFHHQKWFFMFERAVASLFHSLCAKHDAECIVIGQKFTAETLSLVVFN